MIYYLTSHSLWLSGIIIIGLGTALSMCGPSLVRRYVALEKLTAHNEIAGFKFAAVGVLYAVLLAFAIIIVWEKFNAAETDVVREAGAAVTIYRLSDGLGGKPGAELRAGLSNYLRTAIAEDWPAMERNEVGGSRAARRALNDIYAKLLSSGGGERPGDPVLSEILYQLDQMTQARRARLVAAEGAVPDILWFILFGGALITIVFTFFFGTQNLRAQTLMTGLLALLIFSELLIIITIDRPFTGSVKVRPEALAAVLEDFGAEPGSGGTTPAVQAPQH